MEIVFGDAFFFIAWLNDRDAAHEQALATGFTPGRLIVTTDYVLIEVADALADNPRRTSVASFVRSLRQSRSTEIIETDSVLFDKGLALYESRSDKAWSLTDCISFEVMRERKITAALNHDHHFKQAGFHILL